MDRLLSAPNDQVAQILDEFNAKHAQAFTFPDLSLDDRQRLVERLLQLASAEDPPVGCRCLEALRLLSRDRSHLEAVFSADVLSSLVRLARLTGCGKEGEEEEAAEGLPKDFPADVVVEALKTLCNLIYNSSQVQQTCRWAPRGASAHMAASLEGRSANTHTQGKCPRGTDPCRWTFLTVDCSSIGVRCETTLAVHRALCNYCAGLSVCPVNRSMERHQRSMWGAIVCMSVR